MTDSRQSDAHPAPIARDGIKRLEREGRLGPPGQSVVGRLPRGICPECQREVALRVGGELREHLDAGGDKCPASGETIAECERAIEREAERFRRSVHR